MLKNLKARASSTNPRTTFTEFSHPPDFGKEFNQPGKNANSVNGIAKARENANIPMIGLMNAPPADETKILPTSGPVHENDTSTRVNAIKKTPIRPPFSALLSTLVMNVPGKVISNNPRKDKPKTTKTAKKMRFGIHSVERWLAVSGPISGATAIPTTV